MTHNIDYFLYIPNDNTYFRMARLFLRRNAAKLLEPTWMHPNHREWDENPCLS